MKTQFVFLLIILALNLTYTLCYSLKTTEGEPVIPGMEYTSPINATGAFSDYTERFNATDVVDKWGNHPFDGVFIIGDLFTGENQLWNTFGFLVDGVPSMLTWTGSFMPASQSVFSLIANVIRVITAVMFVTLIIEFISGRELMP